MYESAAGLVFILCTIGVFRNIGKAYKAKHLFYKILIGLGLLIICYILAVVISALFGLNGIFAVVCAGIFAEIISLVIYLRHLKKNSKEYKSAKLELIFAIIVPLIVIIIIVAISFTAEATCKYPNEIIGETECCIPNYDYGVKICSEEAEKLDTQLTYAIDNEIVTTKNTETFLGKFSLQVPEGYLAVKNAKAGLYDYPLILMSSDEEGDAIMIIVMYSESVNYYGPLKDIYPEMEAGLQETSIYSTFSEPVFSENKSNGTEIVTLESVNKQEGLEMFISNAFIKKDNKLIAIKYGATSKELYDYYHNEFDEMVNSVTFN